MNLLAHFFLSGTQNELLTVGNFLGDFVKGRKYLNYEPEIRKGILLHRAIDTYTDHHPVVIHSKRRLYERYHHYSAVLVDLYYDHILASGFHHFSSQRLPEFAAEVYALLSRNKGVLPEKASFMLPYLKRDNWLLNYSRIEGIDRACKGIASRRAYAGAMVSGAEELVKHFSLFEEEFLIFFPEVRQHVADWLKNHEPK